MDYQIGVGNRVIRVERNKTDLLVDGQPIAYQIEKKEDRYLIFDETEVTIIRVIEKNSHLIRLEVNGKEVEANVKDHMAQMLEKLGMNSISETVVNEVKAPMPGVILNILVSEGQNIKKGDPLLILEAMKMENLIKSPADATISTISVQKGQSVEKNTSLIQFDL